MTIPSAKQRQTSHIIITPAMTHEPLQHEHHHHESVPLTRTDRIGMTLSGLCAVHCLVLPLALPFLGTLASFLHSEWTHAFFAMLIVPTVVFAAWRGYKHHGKTEVLWLLGIGALAVVVALIAGERGVDAHVETAVTTLGSALLITGHWQNHKHCAICVNGKPHSH
jgi:hypothetical protein